MSYVTVAKNRKITSGIILFSTLYFLIDYYHFYMHLSVHVNSVIPCINCIKTTIVIQNSFIITKNSLMPAFYIHTLISIPLKTLIFSSPYFIISRMKYKCNYIIHNLRFIFIQSAFWTIHIVHISIVIIFYHITVLTLFNHSSIEGYLICFPFNVITNKVAISNKILMYVFVWMYIFISQGSISNTEIA